MYSKSPKSEHNGWPIRAPAMKITEGRKCARYLTLNLKLEYNNEEVYR